MEHEAGGQANGDVGGDYGGEEEEEADDDDDGESLEWEMRNTDSVFSELSELSQDYVESVDRGASVRGEVVGGQISMCLPSWGHQTCLTSLPFSHRQCRPAGGRPVPI